MSQRLIKKSGTMKAILIASLLVLMSSMSGCLIKKDSPAPGCIEYWGPAPMGGCFGKTAILDLKVDPQIDCLTIEVNNCNGGVLEVRNSCSEPLVLGSVEIKSSDGNVGLDVKKENGQYLLTPTAGNFSQYIPQADESIEVLGMLGDQEIKVSFTKTKELC